MNLGGSADNFHVHSPVVRGGVNAGGNASPKQVAQEAAAGAVNVGTNVVPPVVIKHWTHLLESAHRLLDDAHWGAAVIVAQTACEVVIHRAVAGRLNAIGQPALAEPILRFARPFSPQNENVRKVYDLLATDDLGQRPFWTGYKGLVDQRNNAVHRGANIAEQDARTGVAAAQLLVTHIEQHNQLA